MSDEHDCESCPLVDRRTFLRGGAVALALLAVPSIAAALERGGGLVSVVARSVNGAMRAYPLPAADGVQIDHDADIILVRWDGSVYAFDLSCPHQNTALRWDDTSKHFRCPKHHSEYEPTGSFIRGRATRGMDRLGISQQGSQIMIDADKRFEQDRDPHGWETAVIHLAKGVA